MISSTSNAYIKELAKLKQKKNRDASKQFLVEGDHLVNEAYKNGYLLEAFYVNEKDVKDLDCKKTEVSQDVLEKLTFSKTPQKIVGLCKYITYDIDFKKMKRLFLLDDLQDPGNIGTIIRTSLALGFDGVLLSKNSVDLYNDKLLRACQGANFYLPILQGDMLDFIATLKQNDFQVYATSLRNAHNIETFSNEDKMAFVLGNEGNGVSDAVIDKCDGSIYIPIEKAESLNVAITSGIIAFCFKNH